MRKTKVVCAVSLMAMIFLGVAAAAETLDSLELGAFVPFEAEPESQDETDQFVPTPYCAAVTQSPPTYGVNRGDYERRARQFYVSSIIGGSFLVFTADDTPTSILTAGGAIGVALDRYKGRLRVELEGRYRDPIEQTYLGFNREPPQPTPSPPGPTPSEPEVVGTMQAKAYGGWSAMVNLWRDFQLTENLDAYGGGGIGASGFETSFQQIDTATTAPVFKKYITEYSWQLGVGGIWNINDRVAVDLSYRLFGLGWSITAGELAYGYLRTEVLLSLRIYEPFRGLMR
jgi:opacity protein-like surface antigen